MANVATWDVSAANNTSTPPDGWPEGQSRSSVNDCGREMMAAVARWYSDTDGSLVTTGTGSAYVLTSNSAHAALAEQSFLVFRAHEANAASPTLNVDGLGAKAIKTVSGNDLAANAIAADQVVIVAYNATDDVYNLLTPDSILARIGLGTAGQVLATNATPDAPEWADRITLGTPQTGTGADTFFDFTVPTWARRITVSLAQFSTSGTSPPVIQIGDAGGIETTGYLSAATITGTDTSAGTSTGGFLLMNSQAAAAVWHGSVTLTLMDNVTNLWASSGVLGRTDSATTAASGGQKALSAAITTVRLIATNGTDTIDGGTVNVQYE